MKYVLALTFALLVARPALADITFAAVGPITGQDATTGEQMKHGAEAAVAAINEAGGILEQQVQLIIKDDVCDPKQSVAVANELASKGVLAVIGPMCSGSAIPASKIYNEEKILMITPSATSPALTDQGFENVFRTCGRDEQQASVIVDFINKKFSGKSVAIIHDKTSYGQGLADQVRKKYSEQGNKEALYGSISRGERDYGTLISKLKEQNIDVLVFGGYHTEAGLIVRQMRDQGLTTAFISDDDLATHEFWSITGKAGEDTYMSFNTDPRTKKEAENAVRRLRESGFDPEGTTLYTYAAVQVAARAINQVGNMNPKIVAKAMHGKTFPTVIGDITYDEKGDVTNPDYIMYKWADGAYAPVTDQQ